MTPAILPSLVAAAFALGEPPEGPQTAGGAQTPGGAQTQPAQTQPAQTQPEQPAPAEPVAPQPDSSETAEPAVSPSLDVPQGDGSDASAEVPPASSPSTPPADESATKPKRTKRGQFWVAWSIGTPVGGTRDFVDRSTARGIDFGFEHRLHRFFGIGASGGVVDFRDKLRTTAVQENAALYATQLRRIGAFSLLVNARVHLPNRSRVEPYAGLDVGTFYTYRSLDIGWVYFEDNGWHVGLAPTVGMEVHLDKINLLFGSRFNWLPESGSAPEETFFTFHLGLGFPAF